MQDLPFCPRCTVPPHCFSRPTWWPANRVTVEQAKPYWFWRGCSHARALVPLIPMSDAMREETELKWIAAAKEHFDALTAAWSEEQRETFRQKLENQIQTLIKL